MTAQTGIGARVKRKEDQRFLTGTGRYVDDLPLARATYAHFVRSPHAHAKIKSIDTSAAKAMPGVVAIFTGKDIADAKVGGLICGWVVKDKHGQPHKAPPHPVMAVDTVRYVGDTVAMVVANSHDEAKDAAEAIKVDYDVKPANVDLAKALDKGAPEVHAGGAGQPDLRLGNRREGRCRRRLRQGRARHQDRHRQQSPDPQRHGAARRGGGIRQGHGQLHAVVDVAEPARAAPDPVGLRAGHSRAQAARHRPRRGRRLRQQDLLLQRRDDGHLGGEPRRPSDQVDRRAQRIVPDRRARPRPRHPCRAGARQGRQVPGPEGRDHRQHGRVSVDLLDGGADLPLRHAAGRPVHDAVDLRQREGGADAHRAGRRLSRRRTARGDLS